MTVHALLPNDSSQCWFTARLMAHLPVATVIILIAISGCRAVNTQSSSIRDLSLIEDRQAKVDGVSKRDSDRRSKGGPVVANKPNAAKKARATNGGDVSSIAGAVNRQAGKVGSTSSITDDESNAEIAEAGDQPQGKTTNPNERLDRITQTSAAISSDGSEAQGESSLIKILSFTQNDQPTPVSKVDRDIDGKTAPASGAPERPKSLRLKFPTEIPGAGSPTISLPVTDLDHPERKLKAINTLFPQAADPKPLDPPLGPAMTLEELEEMAMHNSPIIAQALASITMSQGETIQAGVYPNPVFGYEADTVGSSFTRNYEGVYMSQTVKVAGKLPLARAVANMDLMNSQLGYERTRQQILHDVRTAYYNVLVSQEANRINGALVRFTNQVYAIMIDRMKNGEQAGYELAQLRTLVKQAQTILVNSQNRYVSSWKQLAVATGCPELPPAPLDGRVDLPVPNLDYDTLLERVLSVHPDLQASRNLEAQARLNLKLQRAIPIPDPTVSGVFQNDSTVPGYSRTSYNINVSVPVPFYDRNQGNIRTALGKLELSSRQYAVATNQLTGQLADAFERYQNGRFQSEYYRTQILPDLARAYRGVFDRHIAASDKVAFGDIIVAQQNLAAGVSAYISSLVLQWTAAVDIANLMQLRDFRLLFSDLPPVPDSPSSGSSLMTPREGAQP
jgi:outer membrane protein, heavy metal efflux system